MIKFLAIYAFIMFFLTFLYHIEWKSGGGLKDVRVNQIRKLVKESSTMQSLERNIRSKVKPSKRNKVERMIEQAGFDMKFEEYVMISFLAAIAFGLIFGVTLSNALLAIVFSFIGYFIPHQYFSFIRNKRLALLENQIGSFMKMSIARYENVKDFNKSLRLVEKEFRGEEPIHSEILKTIREIDVNVPVADAVNNMAERTGNKYMKRFASYYKVAADVGTESVRNNLLTQAYVQYDEDFKIRRELKSEIAVPKQEAYIMVGAVPAFAVYQLLTSEGYMDFMTGSTMGRIGTTAILATMILVVWFINSKLGAPLD